MITSSCRLHVTSVSITQFCETQNSIASLHYTLNAVIKRRHYVTICCRMTCCLLLNSLWLVIANNYHCCQSQRKISARVVSFWAHSVTKALQAVGVASSSWRRLIGPYSCFEPSHRNSLLYAHPVGTPGCCWRSCCPASPVTLCSYVISWRWAVLRYRIRIGWKRYNIVVLPLQCVLL